MFSKINAGGPPNSGGGANMSYNYPQLLGFYSHHSGGAQFLLGDGTVRFISENVNLTTYANLATIADGNVIGAFPKVEVGLGVSFTLFCVHFMISPGTSGSLFQ